MSESWTNKFTSALHYEINMKFMKNLKNDEPSKRLNSWKKKKIIMKKPETTKVVPNWTVIIRAWSTPGLHSSECNLSARFGDS